jgi:cysteine-rich repeat protein
MRLRALGVAAALSAALVPQDSDAVVRPKGAEEPLVSADRAPRVHRTIDWTTIATGTLAGWTAMIDRDTGVPLRLWGRTELIPGAVGDAAIAEQAARQFLADHLGVLAPRAKPSDFVLVANELSPNGSIRSVGFVQHANGMAVHGGAIGFAFKADRLALVSSTALPHVAVAAPMQRLPIVEVGTRAERWLAGAGFDVGVKSVGAQPIVIPIVRPRIGSGPDIEYRVAEEVEVAAHDGAGAWQVWIDATTGAPIARQSRIMYASGKLMLDVPQRHPAGMRTKMPASFATMTIDGTSATAAVDGTVTWSGAGAATVRARGPLINVTTQAGSAVTAALQLMNGGSTTWSLATSETGDAQLSAFAHAAYVKDFVKTRVNPGLAWLNQTLPVSVNESGGCNAFSTGNDIHFLRKSSNCENTARLADVVYHEFGHSLHNNSIIKGVGAWNGALSEGLSDILAMLLTHDHGMGRGFFLSNPNAPMRDLNPPNLEKKWGVHTTGQVHNDGEIIGGTFWDLMVALEAELGASAGFAKTVELWYTVMQRATDIPSSYAEALLGDDDDGNLANGTPNMCTIHAAFAAHNLAKGSPPMGTIDKPTRDGFSISVGAKSGGSAACPAPEITAGEIAWRLRGGADETIAMTLANDQYTGAIPSQPNGSVVQYKVTLSLANGTKVTYPSNPADPYYEWYVGPVTPLWCADFEAGAADWTASADWEADMPRGLGNDPKVAAGGANVYGSDLTKDGVYAANATTFAESPEIDVTGHTGVRLQYQRWLGVEDGYYDKARVMVNGTEVWRNFASAKEPLQDGIHHIDREWRFADFDVAAHEASGTIKLRFELVSDEGLQFGGWTLDDVCLVVPALGPGPDTCGNGIVDDGEACDDGNVSDGDGCSAACEDEAGGGGGGDDQVAGGCCSVGGGPKGALALALVTLGLVLRRRRSPVAHG